jgi:hypothetical protein
VPPPPPNKTMRWALRAAGLVAVAVVSGLVWFYVVDDSTSTPTNGADQSSTQEPEGVYPFKAYESMPERDRVTECAAHAYGDTQGFLKTNKCDHLSRQLFVTHVGERTVYASVSVIVMRDADTADQLRQLTDLDGRGNVNDVLRDGLVTIDGLKTLGGHGGYKSRQTGKEVVIIEADFAPKDKSNNKDDPVLDEVCEDALRLAAKVDSGSGSG